MSDQSGGCGTQSVDGAGGGFVIVCDARSGSSYLCSALSSHPDLACLQELFRRDKLDSRFGVEPFARAPYSDPVAYLRDAYARTRAYTGARLAGFKLHYRNHAGALERVLGDPAHRIILLCRRDKLAQWASDRLALITRQWALSKHAGGIHPQTRVPFRLRRFATYLMRQYAWERYVLRRRPDCLRIDYEDIVPPGSPAPVLRYLGVAQMDLQPGTRRQFGGKSTLERFTNPRWAAAGSRIAYALARLIQLPGAAPLVRRFTRA